MCAACTGPPHITDPLHKRSDVINVTSSVKENRSGCLMILCPIRGCYIFCDMFSFRLQNDAIMGTIM